MKVEEKQSKISYLWFLYGNNGRKHTHGNHKFIQRILEALQTDEEVDICALKSAYTPDDDSIMMNLKLPRELSGGVTEECFDAVREVLENY